MGNVRQIISNSILRLSLHMGTLTKDYNLGVLFPGLNEEWNHEKNEGLRPYDFTPGSHKKVWWRCENGHEWEASIKNRVKGRGCPRCRYKKSSETYSKSIVFQRGSLFEKYPEIAKEWHPELNGIKTPNDYTSASGKKAWWLCKNNHKWEAVIGSRTKGIGCPFCSGKIATTENNLLTQFPEVANQWHPTLNGRRVPNNITPFSNYTAWWKCVAGHEWKTTVAKRTGRGDGCPHCSRSSTSRTEIRVYVELKVLFPDCEWRTKIDGIEIDAYIPSIHLGVEIDGFPWHEGNEIKDKQKNERLEKFNIQIIRLRDSKLSIQSISKNDIIYQSGKSLLVPIQKLIKKIQNISNPPILNEYVDRDSFINEREYQKMISLFPMPLEENSLQKLYPTISEEWDYNKNFPLKPEHVTPGSNQKVWWLCSKCNHSWNISPNNRTGLKSGCPKCYEKVRGENRILAALKKNGAIVNNPTIMSMWNHEKNEAQGLYPKEISPGSHKKVWWRCESGHEWVAKIYKINKGGRCRICRNNENGVKRRLAAVKLNGSIVNNPAIMSMWDYDKNDGKDLNPFEYSPGSHKKVWWRCENGHEWGKRISEQVKIGNCLECKKWL